MWFGKYQGTKLTALPDSYLEWAIENIPKGVDKLKQEYERRHSTT